MSIPDILCLFGICLAAYGLWLIHPAAMYIGVGVVLVGVGVYRVKQKGTKPQ